MVFERRLCVGCLECWTDFLDPLCGPCQYEHDRAIAIDRLSFNAKNDKPALWWGPTEDMVNPEDIEHGFGIEYA